MGCGGPRAGSAAETAPEEIDRQGARGRGQAIHGADSGRVGAANLEGQRVQVENARRLAVPQVAVGNRSLGQPAAETGEQALVQSQGLGPAHHLGQAEEDRQAREQGRALPRGRRQLGAGIRSRPALMVGHEVSQVDRTAMRIYHGGAARPASDPDTRGFATES